MSTRIAVIYYSATGNVHRLAEAYAAGAEEAGAEVRLRRVAEPAPVGAASTDRRAHRDATAHIEQADLDDLRWADGIALGTPTRFGNVSAELKQFLDSTTPLWTAGELAGTPVTGFTASMDAHGGQESTLLALYHTVFHWGGVIVAPGWVDHEIAHAAGGNPYGISQVQSEADDPAYVDAVLRAARWQGGRLARAAEALAATPHSAAA